jgi:hypothetical protein
MAEDRAERPAPWNDRAFGAIPLAPAWIAAGLALALLCLFLVTVIATGDLAEFMEREGRWWQDRDGRLAVLIVLFTAYLPAARRYEELGVRRNLREIHSSVDWAPGQLEAVAGGLRDVDPHGRRVACALALVAIPVTALLVDRDPSLYFRSGYWDATHFWTYGLAAVLCWNVGALVHAISLHARAFSRVARSIPEVDLLNLSVFGPFVRQGMLSALPGVVVLSFLALNLADRGFLWAIGVLGSVALTWTTGSLLLVIRGVRDRIHAAKEMELAGVNAAIRGDSGTLDGAAIAARAGELSLGDLLAYRAFVESVPEWPFDAPARTRFLLYLAIPIGSWLGGALVERLLDAALA